MGAFQCMIVVQSGLFGFAFSHELTVIPLTLFSLIVYYRQENLLYQCDECSVSFNRPSPLQEHVEQFHSAYHCGYCGTACGKQIKLERDMRDCHKPYHMHTVLRFDTAAALQEHVEEDHKSYECGYCKLGFTIH